MKLALFNTLYPTPTQPKLAGGAERSVQILAEALVQAGHEVLVIKGLPPDAHPLVETVEGVRVSGIPIRNRYWPYFGHTHNAVERLLWHARDGRSEEHPLVAEQLDAFQPELVHTNNLSGLSTSVWRTAHRRGIPVVHTLRDYYLLCPRAIRFRNGRNCETSCLECALLTSRRRRHTALVDVAVGISRAVLDTHLRAGLFPDARWRGVIHNPVQPRNVPGPKPAGKITFGFIGSVTEGKGAYLLARAYGSLPARARLLIAGGADTTVRRKLQELAGDRPLTFLGFVTPDAFYPNVDVVVVPSLLHESLSRAVLEAHSFARPVIGATRGGIPEALGDGGWLFDPDDPDALARIMRQVIEEPELVESKSIVALARAARFHPANIVAEYTRVYECALGARPERSVV